MLQFEIKKIIIWKINISQFKKLLIISGVQKFV